MPESASPLAFTMHGTRDVLAEGEGHIERHVAAIEEAVGSNPGLVFDLAKTLIESACKTVRTYRGCGYDAAWELPKLLRETLAELPLVPDGLKGDKAVSESLRRTAGGLQTTIQGICELRNTHGFASHGRDASFQQLESLQAVLVARSADAIVSFLFRAYQVSADVRPQPPVYGEHLAFNEYVDGANVVEIFGIEYRASEVLFLVDPRAYEDGLAEFAAEAGSNVRPELDDE